jgi:hypothetical protein
LNVAFLSKEEKSGLQLKITQGRALQPVIFRPFGAALRDVQSKRMA